ncbi:unnamed protein product (macronuclear) [Paramecium tetraurelia]|uniref:Transmembrane protein n=1 Tax=Paramecium tetraurelia TaxID=5888 RepID=A0D185_PARTE|nr:uncharacterized protein GSPATT00012326001 [Paramecium tetraurelia]CAK76802.1 unnamed protein product [Paramecium tetraurelia]|eukprot:XP_001444199.1 hypothetical protein (macronuclear) [Paramecium tetraurelia strain d4-2]
MITQTIKKLFYLSAIADHDRSDNLRSSWNKIKIIIYFIQVISLLFIDNINIYFDNYILVLARFITFQQIQNSYYQTLVLIAILSIHLIMLLMISLLLRIKTKILVNTIQFYLSNYDWLFLIPSQIFCFINQQFVITVLSILVLFLSASQYIISIYIFRNSGFITKNGRAQNITFDLIYIFIFESIIFLRIGNLEIITVIKYFLVIAIVLVKILEFITIEKFSDKTVQSFYQIFIIITFVFIITNQIHIYIQFYCYFRYSSILFQLLNFFYAVEQSHRLEAEYFYYNAIQKFDPQCQIKAYQQISNHKKKCKNITCPCQARIRLENKQEIIKFTAQILKLEQQFCYLKYISFQIQNNNKGFKNYLQIMKVVKQQKDIGFSFYDKIMIQSLLEIVCEKTKQLYKEVIPNKFTEVVYSLQWFESNCERIKNQLLILLNTKLRLWSQYVTDKIESYQDMYEMQIKITYEINKIRQALREFQYDIQIFLNQEINLTRNLFYQRVSQILELSFYSVNKYLLIEKRIKKIVEFEQGQGDLLNYQMFENQKAMQLLVVISKHQRGRIEKVSNKWLNIEKFEHLSNIMPMQFIELHNQLLDNYCRFGPSKSQIFQTFIKYGDTPLVSKVKICLNNYPKYDHEKLYLMGTLVKDNIEEDQDYILVGQDFQILGYSEQLWFKIFQHLKFQDGFQELSIFQILPEVKSILKEHYENMQKYNHSFQNHEKIISHQQKAVLYLNKTMSKQMFNSTNLQEISPQERLDKIESLSNNYINYENCELQLNMMFSLTENLISYNTKENKINYIYYWVTFNFQEINSLLDKQFNQQLSYEVQVLEENKIKKIQFNQVKINESITKTSSSMQKSNSEILSFQQVIGIVRQLTAYRLLMLLSASYILWTIIAFILLYQQIWKKEIQQTECFEQLDYSTSFLDGYGRAMIASRHVIYLRDFNKFLTSYNLYPIDSETIINVTSVDKISFSLYIYKQSIEELVEFFQKETAKLKIYDQQNQSVDLIRINFYKNQTEIQTILSLSQYYKIMLQTLYMAIKSFAKDPTLYLIGTTDTWAQVNTRSILYFNFKRVANITLNFMKQCQIDDKQINDQLDFNLNVLLIIIYSMILVQIILFIILYSAIKKKQRFVLSLFCRTSLNEGIEEIAFIQKLLNIVKNSKLWFGLYEYDDEEENKITRSYSGKAMKSHISHHLSSRVLLKLIIPLVIISYGSFLTLHMNYIDYSINLSPIVTAALKTQYIRLLFLDTINNWDVYVNQKFYESMIAIQPTATGRYKITSQNINHGYQLLRLTNVDVDALKANLLELQSEPFSNMIYSQTLSVDSDSLLGQDICLMEMFNCNMNQTVYKERVHYQQMYAIYEVGIINLFKQSISVMNQNDFFSLDENYDIINAFERLEKSQEYFFYFLWGFDAFLYQMRLFSEFFIDLSKTQLQDLSFNIYIIFYLFSIVTTLSLAMILLFGNIAIQQEFIHTLEMLYQIPKQTIINKQLGRQIKLL